tara:strand:- start:1610 stop:2455 length:846 start_codon:yes stop_codon:yes gene_type:complete
MSIIITAIDGYKLSALYSTPVAENIGTIVLSSATGVKKEFYRHFKEYLVRNGYNVLLYDYRGIGGSAPNDLRGSFAYMHEWGTMDMNAALNYLVEEKGLTNIIWFGHSLGAQLIGFLEKQQHIKKVISLNAAVGYWGLFPFPMNITVCFLWYVIYPVMIKFYGYGAMSKIGWGENLPKNVLGEWREWCLNKDYFKKTLQQKLNTDKFYLFTTPITALYISDDYIANDKTVPPMQQFFPNAPYEIIKIKVKKYTSYKVGHTGIFRKKFENTLWPLLVDIVEK